MELLKFIIGVFVLMIGWKLWDKYIIEIDNFLKKKLSQKQYKLLNILIAILFFGVLFSGLFYRFLNSMLV